MISNNEFSFCHLFVYANILVCNSEEGMRRMLGALETGGNGMGLVISEEKTKYMLMSRSIPTCTPMKVGNRVFEGVSKFKYLGAIVTSDARMDQEIISRIHAGDRALASLNGLLRMRVLSRKIKKNYTIP